MRWIEHCHHQTLRTGLLVHQSQGSVATLNPRAPPFAALNQADRSCCRSVPPLRLTAIRSHSVQ